MERIKNVGTIKLIMCDSKNIYNVTKYLLNAVLLNFLFIK